MARTHATVRKSTSGVPSVTTAVAGVSAAVSVGTVAHIASSRRIPTGVSATASAGIATGPSTSFLSWTAEPLATGYKVYWGLVPGPPYANSVDVGNVTSITSASLPGL